MAEPVYAIIENFYSSDELTTIWEELDFFLDNNLLLEPHHTGSAINTSGQFIKNNKALFLDLHYATNREDSAILRLNRKIFSKEITDNLIDHNPIFRYLQTCNVDTTMISYYESGSYYKPHIDVSAITILTYFFKEPKKFTGGDFKLIDFNETISPQNNMVLIMPSCYLHQATDVTIQQVGYGRFCMSQFLSFR
jgi:Rps23 Pro-64 3,4-dihydroxylase Tpa1-like proline 4-hydroxylase